MVAGDRLYTVTDSGIASCVDALTGRELWKERIGGEFSASPLFADGRVYFFDRKGITKVIEPGDIYNELAKTRSKRLHA